jgi:hypothetical protein
MSSFHEAPREDYQAAMHREEVVVLDDLLVDFDALVPFGGASMKLVGADIGRFE